MSTIYSTYTKSTVFSEPQIPVLTYVFEVILSPEFGNNMTIAPVIFILNDVYSGCIIIKHMKIIDHKLCIENTLV